MYRPKGFTHFKGYVYVMSRLTKSKIQYRSSRPGIVPYRVEVFTSKFTDCDSTFKGWCDTKYSCFSQMSEW